MIERGVLFTAAALPTVVLWCLLLAVIGALTTLTVSVGIILAIVGGVVAARSVELLPLARPSCVATVAVWALVVGFIVFNGVFAGEHLLTDRDQGAYLNTAQWVRNHGDLLVVGGGAPFPESSELVAEWSASYDVRDDGRMYFQFSHGFPTLMAATGIAFGTRAMLWVNPVLGGLVLGLMFILLIGVARPWAAFVIVAALAANVSFFFFFRDTYSEPLVFALVMLALVSVWIAVRSGSTVGLYLAGLCLGAATSVRIDSWLFVAGWFAVLAMWVINQQKRPFPDRAILHAGLVTLAASVIGIVDLWLRSPPYVTGRSHHVVPMAAVTATAVVIFIVLWLLRFHARPFFQEQLGDDVSKRVKAIGTAVVAGSFGFFLFVYPNLTRGLSEGDWTPWMEDFLRSDDIQPGETVVLLENSLVWFTWYWGWVAVLAAIAGVLIFVYRKRERWTIEGVVLIVVALPLLVYVVRPSISPYHMWAMRRFLVAGGIFVAVGLALAVEEASRGLRRLEVPRVFVLATGAVATLVLVVGTVTVAPALYSFSSEKPLLGATEDLCRALPVDAAVVTVGQVHGFTYSAAIRTFCDAPVVWWQNPTGKLTLNDIRDEVSARGYRLVVISAGMDEPVGSEVFRANPKLQVERSSLVGPPQAIDLFEFPIVAEYVGP